ncbi:PspA/IM30 family protein [Bacillus velezensis]|uniref:PspA/IM30 family protein n=1 Tax=Bacillus TaxID=1386 RepID=UPI0006A5DCEF|nr:MULTISPECIES: PspA/IM30 family protein [Bacillus]KOC81188.1 phage-shock protein [Bacillus velezensis]KSV97441.1 phage shock protein A [Bacillus velezensis]KSW01625.1 phage shock protein A [Bacillus velezensis]MCX2853506.1 PspA/IM30 family protein [Bacillus sp. KeR2]QLG06353.1 PspA/IM30 family protein [Bacillus velezensis]
MSILGRFKDIMSSNINALLDKAENPEKMVDQYLRNLNSDLGKVKAETASVMAEEQRAKRALTECQADAEKMENYAMKALQAGNEADARAFLERKAAVESRLTELQTAYQLASSNASQMRKMHDKLVADIGELESRRNAIKAKWSVAKTQERMNKLGSSVSNAGQSLTAFGRMEDKVNQALDHANAMAELNASPKDDIDELAAKYDSNQSSVDDELAALKQKMLFSKDQ